MFVPIANVPRGYDWGSRTLMADYLGRAPSGGPEAELWFGAHPGSPATVTAGPHRDTALDLVLHAEEARQPTILLKVLAAGAPLSLQVHPDAEQAREGFEREEAAGIPRDAPHRTYRDPFPKPELIVAVTAFEALSGFRPHEEAVAVLDALSAVDARIATVAPRVRAGDALEWLLSGAAEVAEAVAAAPAAAAAIAAAHPTDADTVARLAATHPGDPGILIALLLNRVTLAPGEALSLPAGNIHAYLAGLGIELMRASDNVLRCALTSKHIDVPELLAIVDHEPLVEPRLLGMPLAGATAYRPASPFELRRIEGAHRAPAGRALLLAASPTTVLVDGARHALQAGEGAWIDTDDAVSIEAREAWLALERDTPETGAAGPTAATLLESST